MEVISDIEENRHVELPLKYTILISVFILICSFSFIFSAEPNTSKVDQLYLKELSALKINIKDLQELAKTPRPHTTLQRQFKVARLAYKKVAVLTEYFNIADSKKLNGPTIDRVEEDNPDKIIHPTGMQVLESILFSEWSSDSNEQLAAESSKTLEIISNLEMETDRELKFKPEPVFDAMSMAIIRMITSGISGLDSPVALNSLPEAAATLDGIKILFDLYREDAIKKSGTHVNQFYARLNAAKKYLSEHNNFNSFNRIEFIANYANPLYSSLREIRMKMGLLSNAGMQPFNRFAKNIFAFDAFNIDFFSPGENYRPTYERIALGKKLFYDPILSGTSTRTCASCHKPEKAFTDGLKIPVAIDNEVSINRNTPTLLNSALQTAQFYDSRIDVLENQLSAVVHNGNEMRGSLKKAATEMKNNAGYVSLFRQAYPTTKDTISPYLIANAISSYVRSLLSLNSRFDQYMRGDKSKLSEEEKKGFNLFMGKAKCGTCHFIPLFNGLVPTEFSETESEVIGVPQTRDTVHAVLDNDEGKILFTRASIHRYAFKTPTLRNIELTAPYMHNGVYETLEEVMNFYNKGGGKGLGIAPQNQTLPFDKLNLTKKEIQRIISFLKSLTDTSINKSNSK